MLIQLLGWIVSFLSRTTGFESENMTEQWLRLIECCSDEAQTATLREAVCLSMKKAFVYLLDNAADKRDHSLLGRTDVLLRIWLLLLRLLQVLHASIFILTMFLVLKLFFNIFVG